MSRIALAFCLTSGTAAYALGFGDIRLDSALGQRLDAYIPITSVSPGERRSLSVRMAGPEAFERFGIERAAVIDAIELAVEDAGAPGGRLALRLTSEQPIQAPFLNFLIVAETGDGRMLREYTVLLDPPGWTPGAAPVAMPRVQAVQPAPVVSSAVLPATPAQNTAAPAVVVLPEGRNDSGGGTPDAAPSTAGRSGPYGPVGAGETLWSIASRTRFPDVSTYQMLLAIYRANPSAFDGSINLLLQGSMLDIPPAPRVRAVDAAAARRIVANARRQTPHTEAIVPVEPVQVSQAQPAPVAPDRPIAFRPEIQPSPEPEPEAAPVAADGRLRLEVPREFPVIHGVDETAPSRPAASAPGRLVGPEFGTLSPAPVVVATAAAPGLAADGDQVPGGIEPAPVAADAVATATNTAFQPTDKPSASVEDGVQNATAGNDAAAEVTASDVAGGDAPADAWIAPGSARDVASGQAASLLSPSNILLLLAALGLLIALLLWQRRRQYKPVPADFSAGFAAAHDDHADAFDDAAPDAPGQPAEHDGMPAVPGVSADIQLQDAENQIAIGLHDQARTTIEDGLSHYPGHAGLQDKLLELDYVTGDADRFRADVDRFRTALARNGVRWAGISAMGRILAPDDPRFAFGKTEAETPASQTPVDALGPEPPAPPAEPVAQTQPQAGARPPEQSLDYDNTLEEEAQPADAPETQAPDADDVQASEHTAPKADAPDVDAPEAETSSNGLELDIENTNLNDWSGTAADDVYSMPHNGKAGPLPDDYESLEPDVAPVRAVSGNGDRTLNDRAGDDATSFDIDLSEFDLDDDAPTEAPTDEDDADPVETRLDVARMYIEMEDPGSARGLLYEVAEDGNAEQRGAAQALLDAL